MTGTSYYNATYNHTSNHTSSHSSHSSHHVPEGQYLVVFTGFVLFLGCLFKWLQIRLKISVPYTVILLFLGIIIDLLSENDFPFGHLANGFSMVREIDPHMILFIFIPGLIFESAFNTNYHIFVKERGQAILLAGTYDHHSRIETLLCFPFVFPNSLLGGVCMG